MSWEILTRDLVVSVLLALLAYYLGLKSKKPWVIADDFIWNDKRTSFKLKNVGESTAKNIRIDDIIINLEETLFNIFPDVKGNATFKFEKLDYLEPKGDAKEVKCNLFFDDGKSPSDAGRTLLSIYLRNGRMLKISYKDSFGLSHATQFVLNKDRIDTR